MKWIGQHIWDLISRFRYYVYIEKADPSTSTRALVIDEEGKVGTNSTIGTGGVDSVTTTDGTYIDMTPNVATTGAVTVASDLSAVDGTSVAATRFLSKDNTWDVPSYSPLGTVTSITTTIDGNCLTISTAASQTITTSGTFDLEFVGSSAQYISGEGNLITFPTIPAVGVASFTNANGTYISAATVNTAATGIVTTGIIDLSAVDGTSDSATRFLSKDNTWDVPSYTVLPAAGVTSFSNANGTFVANATTNTLSTGAVTLGRVDLSASGTPNLTTFLRGDNTWAVPGYTGAGVTTFTNANGTFISAATVNTGAAGAVTTGAIDLSATGTPSATNFLCGDNTWKVPAYAAGTVTSIGLTSDAGSTSTITTSGTFTIAGGTNVTTSATGTTVTVNSTDQYTGTVTAVTGTLPIVSSGGATPAISINAATDTTKGSVELATAAEAITGTNTTMAVTPAGVKAAIDARYTYSYFPYSFRCTLTNNSTTEQWFFPSDNGITKYEWNNRVAGSVVPGSIALAETITVDRFSFSSGIFIPEACELAGFYGNVRMANNAPNTANPVIAVFYNAPITNGSTTNITPECIAFDTASGGGSRLNRMNVIESSQTAILAAGSIIFVTFGQDVALTSVGVAIGQITLKFKTLIPA
tara:strand:- start:3789 stop:5714 length:1926 start_codon:yes stop_codon:yes gene_type:complete